MFSKIIQPLKELIGEKNEVISSVDLAVKDRISSPFYGYFLISWFIINWKILYIAFFVSQNYIFEKSGLLRHEYIAQSFPLFWSLEHFLNFFVYPFLMTFIFFWMLPVVTKIFYRKSLKNQKALRIIEIQESTEEKKQEKELIKVETGLIREKSEKEKVKNKVERETPEVLWEKEFEQFNKNNLLFFSFDSIIKSIYEKSGHIISGSLGYANYFKVPTDILAYCDANGLINVKENVISFTEKGKFFLKKYSELKK